MLERNFRARGGACVLMLLLAMLTTRTASADNLTLAWDANPESDVVGYYVFIGTSSGVYTTVVDVGGATSFTYSSALPATTYYLTVAAYVAGPIMGPYAPEIVTTTGRGPILSNPGNRTNTRGEAVSFSLSASDPDGDAVVFGVIGLPNGLSLNTNTGAITGTVTAAGTFNVSVSASDPAEHVTTQYFVWTVVPSDEVAPTIALSSPTSSATYSTSNTFITLSGTASDDVGVTAVTWANNRGGSGTAAGTSNWSVVIPLHTGTNVLTMAARDATNKSSNTTLTVAVDLMPTVTISSPTSSGTFSSNGPTLSLGGSASDDGSISSVRWSNSRGGTGTASGTTAWSAAIPLQIGTNVITVTAQDNASKNATSQLTVSFLPPPLRVTSLTANRTSPQPAGTTITFSASAAAGIAPYQYKWWIFNGSSWSAAADWSASHTFEWTPTSRNDNYRIGVWVRSAGQLADSSDNDQSNSSLSFVVTEATSSNQVHASESTPSVQWPLRVTALTADRSSPQAAGTTITFTTEATGGTAPYQYKWWVYNGASWVVSQNWSTNSSFAWTPSSANVGYKVGVWVRSASATADSSENDASNRSLSFAITGAASAPSVAPAQPELPQTPAPTTPVTLLGLTADKAAPQTAGTSITFVATAAEGSGSYQYKWWLYNGSSWSILQDWSTSSSHTWVASAPGSGYRIGVWVRNAGSTLDASDNARSNGSLAFPIVSSPSSSTTYTPASPLRLIALTPNVTSPQPAGTSITVSAVAIGGVPQYQYKWWVFDGGQWIMMRDWSQSSSFTWTPGASGAGYRIGVWVRSSTSTLDMSDNNGANGSVSFIVR